MNMRWFFTLMIFLPLSVFAQSNFIKVDEKIGCVGCGDIDASNLHLVEQIFGSGQISDTLAACYFHCLGVFYYNDVDNRDYLKSIKNHGEALALRKKYHREFVWKSYYGLGLAYNDLSMYKKSQSFLQTTYNTTGIKRTKDSIEMLRIMADNLSKIGELQQAEEFGLQATQIKVEPHEQWRTARVFNNLVAILGREEQSDYNKKRAIKYADTAIHLYRAAGEDEYYIAQALNNKADALSWLEDYEGAIKTYDLTLKIYDKDSEEYAETLNNKGSDLSKNGNYQTAEKTLLQSLKIKEDLYKKTHAYTYAANYENLGEVYLEMKNYDEALRHFQLAIDNLKDDPKSEAPYIYNKPDLLRILDLKAQAALKNGNNDLAHDTYQVLDEWINEAFEYAEKARAVLLWQSHSQQAALSLLSDEERENYDNLLAQIQQAIPTK